MKLFAPWFVLLLFLSGTAAGAERVLSLTEAVQLALSQNADLRVAQADVSASEARLRGASLLFQQNPEIGVRAGPRTRGTEQSLELEAELSLPVEIGGQRGARRDATGAALASAQERHRQRRIATIASVQRSYARVAAAEQLVELATEAEELARRSLEIAQQRFEAGDTARLDVNSARVELGRARRDVRASQQERSEAVAELRQILAMPADAQIRTEGPLKSRFRKGPNFSSDDLVSRHPAVIAARHEVDEAESELRLANRALVPSPRVGVAYGTEEGARIVQGTLSFDLPILNQNQGERGVSAARVTTAQLELAAVERQVRNSVLLTLSRHEAASGAAADFEGEILSAAEENLRLINDAYAAGKVDFLQLLLVRRDTIETRRAYIAALESVAAAEAALLASLGLEELPR